MPRIFAALVAGICWLALAVRFALTNASTGDVLATLWVLARYFTILTSLAVAVAMTLVALGRRLSPGVEGGLTLAVVLVGVVYSLLLAKLYHLTGAALFADVLMHKVTPVAMVAYWLIFAKHGPMRWSEPLWWSIYPLGYLAYVLARGAVDGLYPYPFLDVRAIGAMQVALNCAAIAAAFLLAGLALVWLDRRLLGRRMLLSKARG